MAISKTEKIVTEIVMPIITEMNLELVDVEYVKEGADWCMKISIDKEGGVFIDDCERVSRRLSKLLDEKDPIPDSYFLEVSSPGIDRPLKKESDFIRFNGCKVTVKLYKNIDKKKEFVGVLTKYTPDEISIIDADGKEHFFLRKDIAIVRLSSG